MRIYVLACGAFLCTLASADDLGISDLKLDIRSQIQNMQQRSQPKSGKADRLPQWKWTGNDWSSAAWLGAQYLNFRIASTTNTAFFLRVNLPSHSSELALLIGPNDLVIRTK